MSNLKFIISMAIIVTLNLIFSYQAYCIDELKVRVNRLNGKLVKYEFHIDEIQDAFEQEKLTWTKLSLRITAYTPSKDETNDDPNNTAIMERPIPGRTCAVSRDLLHLLGKDIYIEDFGVRRVNDLMNARYEKSIDLLVGNKSYAKQIGIQEKEVVVIN